MLGEAISHYRILEKLGQGGMGEVYLAHDEHLRRKVALKFLAPQLVHDRQSQARFRNEALAAAELSHPSIATIYDYDEVNGKSFLVLEYVEGCTLAQRIAGGPLPIEDVIRVGEAVAAGLAKAHSHGIVHRDIKSANLMLTPEDEVKILDFGLAHRMDATQLTLPGAKLGTVAYMSPEQARGDPVDERSDLWSLGVVLFECLTGRLPFSGESTAVLEQILAGGAPHPTGLRTGIPLELEQLILRCLEKDPSTRPQHADEVLASLRLLERRLDSDTTRASDQRPGAQSAGRRRLFWSLAPVSIAALVGWFLLGDSLGRRASPPARADEPRIVVLPFESIGEPRMAYFEDGLAEELTTALVTVEGLCVIGTRSVKSYRDSQMAPIQIAQDLDADYFLTGSVRWGQQADDSGAVRVSARLVNAKDSAQIWGASSTRGTDDIFLAQASIATQVVHALDLTLGDARGAALDQPPTNDSEAYELYLQGLEFERRMKGRNAIVAESFYEQATNRDPEFGSAWARLARVRAWLAFTGLVPEMAEPARIATSQARATLGNSFEADLAEGYYHYWVRHEIDEAAPHFESAVAKAPSSALAHYSLAAVTRRQGNWARSTELYEQAYSLDPRNVEFLMELANMHGMRRNFQRSLLLWDRLIALAPHDPGTLFWVARTHMRAGDPRRGAEATAALIENVGLETILANFLVMELLRTYADELEPLVAGVEKVPELEPGDQGWTYFRHVNRAVVLERLGRGKESIECYERLYTSCDSLAAGSAPAVRGMRLRWLGYAAAKTGRVDEAKDAAERLEALAEASDDQFQQLDMYRWAAEIHALAGSDSRALDLVEELLAAPAGLCAGELTLDPVWEPLRAQPRFADILEQYGEQPVG